MVLSVVAMSAAFAGGAAAKQPDSATSDGVTYTSATELDGDDVWVGQQVTVGNNISGSGFEIHKGLSGKDNYVTTVRVKEGQGSFTIDDKFEVGEPYHIQSTDDATWVGTEFWVGSENLNVDFASTSVGKNSDTKVNLESERGNQFVNVSADGLDATQLNKIFNAEQKFDGEGTVALNSVPPTPLPSSPCSQPPCWPCDVRTKL